MPFFEVGAGAEGAAVAGQDGAAQGWLGVVPAPESVELVVAWGGDAVQVFGAVEGYEEDGGVGEGRYGALEGGWWGGEEGGHGFLEFGRGWPNDCYRDVVICGNNIE